MLLITKDKNIDAAWTCVNVCVFSSVFSVSSGSAQYKAYTISVLLLLVKWIFSIQLEKICSCFSVSDNNHTELTDRQLKPLIWYRLLQMQYLFTTTAAAFFFLTQNKNSHN